MRPPVGEKEESSSCVELGTVPVTFSFQLRPFSGLIGELCSATAFALQPPSQDSSSEAAHT